MSRRQLVADGWANLRFRLRGSTDEDDARAARPDLGVAEGHPGTRPRAARRRRARRHPAAHLPADAGARARAPGRRPARVHRHRRLAGARRDPRPRAGARRRRSARSSRRSTTASTPATRRACSSTARARRARSRSSRGGRGSTWPSPTPTRTPRRTCRCSSWSATRSRSTPTASCSGRPRERLAGASLRPARPAAEDAGGTHRGGSGRRNRQRRLGGAATRPCVRLAGVAPSRRAAPDRRAANNSRNSSRPRSSRYHPQDPARCACRHWSLASGGPATRSHTVSSVSSATARSPAGSRPNSSSRYSWFIRLSARASARVSRTTS